jgi:hypothetical protein
VTNVQPHAPAVVQHAVLPNVHALHDETLHVGVPLDEPEEPEEPDDVQVPPRHMLPFIKEQLLQATPPVPQTWLSTPGWHALPAQHPSQFEGPHDDVWFASFPSPPLDEEPSLPPTDTSAVDPSEPDVLESGPPLVGGSFKSLCAAPLHAAKARTPATHPHQGTACRHTRMQSYYYRFGGRRPSDSLPQSNGRPPRAPTPPIQWEPNATL